STPTTSWPTCARHAAVVRPTCPVPMTETRIMDDYLIGRKRGEGMRAGFVVVRHRSRRVGVVVASLAAAARKHGSRRDGPTRSLPRGGRRVAVASHGAS